MEPASYLEGGRVTVSDDTYAVITSERAYPDAFATVRDGRETTVVIRQDALDEADALDVEPDWTLLTFDLELPFELVGFLSVVASALAAADVPIFAISAYSTDHVLVKRADVATAVGKLEELGCEVVRA